MRSVETEGESIDEAIERALEGLRLSREQVEIEILENGTRGLFGIGSRRARVRATARLPVNASIADTASPAPGVSRETRGQTASPADSTARRAREILEAILPHLVSSPRVEATSDGEETGTVRLSSEEPTVA
jgi:predicted RNA-binding protein Jag